MLTYTQIEAIYEAMRGLTRSICEDGFGCQTEYYDCDETEECFAKIRAALAGEKASDDGSP